MKRMGLCTGIHEKTDVLLTIHLIVLGKISAEEGKDQGKHQRVHAHSQQRRLTRHEHTLAGWRDGQQHAWSQEHEQDGGHDHVSWAQGHLEHKLGNQVVHEGQNQSMDQDWTGAHAQEQAWAEQGEQDGWGQNLGAGDIHVGRYYLPRKLSDKLGKVVERCVVHECAGHMVILEILTKGHPHVEDILRVPVVPIRRVEHELTVLLLIISLLDLLADKDSVVTVLVVDTHGEFLLGFLTCGPFKRLS